MEAQGGDRSSLYQHRGNVNIRETIHATIVSKNLHAKITCKSNEGRAHISAQIIAKRGDKKLTKKVAASGFALSVH